MRRGAFLRAIVVGAAFLAAFFATSSRASADSLDNPVDQVIGAVEESNNRAVTAASLVEQAEQALGQWGVTGMQVDDAIGHAAQAATTFDAAVDDAVGTFDAAVEDLGEPGGIDKLETPYGQAPAEEPGQPLTNPEPLGITHIQEATQPEFEPVVADPNYRWRNDAFSKVAAMRPTADYVLHRVPGSYFDAPRIPEESNQAMGRKHSLYGPGTPLYVGKDMMCTLTVAGHDRAGNKVGLTAGHCGDVGEAVSSADSWQMGPTGTVVDKNEYLDYSVIQFSDRAEVTSEYNGVKAYGLGGGINPGQVTCKRGVASGTTCGMVFVQGQEVQINQVCAMVGDSGAPLFKDGRVIGAVTGGIGDVPCRTPWQGAMHSPTVASNMDAVTADLDRRGGIGSGFRLA